MAVLSGPAQLAASSDSSGQQYSIGVKRRTTVAISPFHSSGIAALECYGLVSTVTCLREKQRNFIFFRLICMTLEEALGSACFFQRVCNFEHLWVGCGLYHSR